MADEIRRSSQAPEGEDSPQRSEIPPAADLFGSIDSGEITYLGDPNAVDAMIRNFLAEAIRKREDVMEGRSEEDLQQWLRDRIERDVNVFLGRGNSVALISPEWNNPRGGIVDAVKAQYDLTDGSPEEIMAAPYYDLIRTFLSAVELDKEGEPWQHLIDGQIELMRNTLLGYGSLTAIQV